MRLWYVEKTNRDIDTVIHCAAQTSAAKCSEDVESTFDTNIIGTANVAKFCQDNKMKLVYVSTDYVFDGNKDNPDPRNGTYKEMDFDYAPLNKYSKSKLAGEFIAKMVDRHQIIRCSFTENRWPYSIALVDHYTSKETVDKTASKIIKLSLIDFNGIIHIGGKRQSVYEYASSLENGDEIYGVSSKDFKSASLIPKDSSLDTRLYDHMLSSKYI